MREEGGTPLAGSGLWEPEPAGPRKEFPLTGKPEISLHTMEVLLVCLCLISSAAFPSVTLHWHSSFLPEIPLASFYEKRWRGVRASWKVEEAACHGEGKQNIQVCHCYLKKITREVKVTQSESVAAQQQISRHRVIRYTRLDMDLICLAGRLTAIYTATGRSLERFDKVQRGSVWRKHVEAIMRLWRQGEIHSIMSLWRTWQGGRYLSIIFRCSQSLPVDSGEG